MGTFHTVTGVFCNGASWGGFFASVPRGFFATVPACGGFFASVSTSRQGNFKTTKITAGKLRFFGISSYSRLFSSWCVSERRLPPQMHRVFLHLLFLSVMFLETISFPRPDKATFKQHKLQLENFGFSVFLHILVYFLRDVSVRGASPRRCIGCFCFFL